MPSGGLGAAVLAFLLGMAGSSTGPEVRLASGDVGLGAGHLAGEIVLQALAGAPGSIFAALGTGAGMANETLRAFAGGALGAGAETTLAGIGAAA